MEVSGGAAEDSARPLRVIHRQRVTRRGVATRAALLRAAGEQFGVAGYQGASLEAILARAGVTKGSLYFHFSDKAALAQAVITAGDRTQKPRRQGRHDARPGSAAHPDRPGRRGHRAGDG